MSSILITGSSGFLGKEIVHQHAKHHLFKLNRNTGEFKFDLSASIPFFDKTFDIVIHNAGLAHTTPVSITQKEEFFKVNKEGTKNLLKGLEKCIPKKFVFISSVSVYGIDQGVFISEKKHLLAKDPYGQSKIQAEKIVEQWCKQNNVICTILRLPLVVGENPPGNLGSMINGIKKGFYFNISGGSAKKSMVLASDVAKYIVKASEIGGTYNLTDGYHPSFFELSAQISNQLGKRMPKNLNSFIAKSLAVFGDIIGENFPLNSKKLKKITSNLTFDDSKARKAFGWNPTPVLEGFKLKK